MTSQLSCSAWAQRKLGLGPPFFCQNRTPHRKALPRQKPQVCCHPGRFKPYLSEDAQTGHIMARLSWPFSRDLLILIPLLVQRLGPAEKLLPFNQENKLTSHGCCWDIFHMFAYCGLVGNPNLTAQRQPRSYPEHASYPAVIFLLLFVSPRAASPWLAAKPGKWIHWAKSLLRRAGRSTMS